MANFSSIHHGWNLAIDTYFSKDHVVEIDLDKSTCVFRLPKTTTETNPQAYAPRRLGLGPYHHLRSDYKKQLEKISSVREFLGSAQLPTFEQIVQVLVKREPVVRACYDQYLDFDIKTLAEILALDALYLLQLLDATIGDEVGVDILMVENQIPSTLFKVVLEVLELNKIISSAEEVLSTKFLDFFKEYTPFNLNNTQFELKDGKQLHLLDRMYQSIILDIHSASTETEITIPSGSGMKAAAAEASSQILAMVQRAREIHGGANEELTSIPTASELREISGVEFRHTPGGIRSVFYNADEKTLQLPMIRIDGNSEILLRNLVAYEEAAGATPELAEYLHFMCGLIHNQKDFMVLKQAEIIIGDATYDGVIGVFDRIGRLMGDSRGRKCRYVAEHGSKSYDSSVKVKGFVNKYFSVVWSFLILVSGVLVVAVLVMQAFCSVFVCRRWVGVGSSAAVQALSYM